MTVFEETIRLVQDWAAKMRTLLIDRRITIYLGMLASIIAVLAIFWPDIDAESVLTNTETILTGIDALLVLLVEAGDVLIVIVSAVAGMIKLLDSFAVRAPSGALTNPVVELNNTDEVLTG